MCKTKTKKIFNSFWKECIEEMPHLKGDKIAKSEGWANFIDSLCKDGEITEKQYENWLE